MADDKEEVAHSPDVHFEPIVSLPKVDIITMEEDEEEMLKLRAKLFRYDSESDPAEWKERGVGDMKILRHKHEGTCRVLMRRDKTHKVCANHHILPEMTLRPNCGSDRAWVWSTLADFADEEPKTEMLAVRFNNADNAGKFKEKFEEAQKIMADKLKDRLNTSAASGDTEDTDEKTESKATAEVSDKLGELSVKDKTADESKAEDSKQSSQPPDDKDQAGR